MAGGINPIGNLQGKVDSNNALVVAIGSGSTLPNDVDVDAGTGTADAGIGGVLTASTTTAQTGANTDETDLWTYSLPANTLSANNYGVRIRVFGSCAANGNTKTIRLYFGGTLVRTIGSGAFSGSTWTGGATSLRSTATTHEVVTVNNVAGTVGETYIQVTADSTAAIVIKVTGQNGTASSGDIVFRGAIVEFLRAGS